MKEGIMKGGPVVYWMSRDQRVNDNWALLFAQELAISKKLPLAVIFCLVPSFLGATIRQYSFMIKGLQKLEKNLSDKRIPFFLLKGSPEKEIPKFIKKYKVSSLITDFNPLHIKKNWDAYVANNIDIPFYQVDAHNIVPCWLSSPKQEYSAHTFRPKIHKALPEFLEDYPELKKHPISWRGDFSSIDWKNSLKSLDIDFHIPEVYWIKSGEDEAHLVMKYFLENKLFLYDKKRNDPTKDGQSNLSPYLHFGQISAQSIVLEVMKTNADEQSKNTFLEELIVRKELSDNYCFYNMNYDNFNGLPEWAKKTLNKHRDDRRKYIYTLEQFENAKTHDDLWNAAQMEMVKKGKMHGYMRMYWAKKILEWSESPEQAFKIAIYLNDKYELDGRDPNGYTGIAWSLGGLHDRAWNERPIFGKVRYMSYNGCKSKFDVIKYIQYVKYLTK
ncbi:MAG: deoxyribodipyrimidine photo-lyase [Thermodesulfovibrionales bacterium]